jgi:hypothetical protein
MRRRGREVDHFGVMIFQSHVMRCSKCSETPSFANAAFEEFDLSRHQAVQSRLRQIPWLTTQFTNQITTK